MKKVVKKAVEEVKGLNQLQQRHVLNRIKEVERTKVREIHDRNGMSCPITSQIVPAKFTEMPLSQGQVMAAVLDGRVRPVEDIVATLKKFRSTNHGYGSEYMPHLTVFLREDDMLAEKKRVNDERKTKLDAVNAGCKVVQSKARELTDRVILGDSADEIIKMLADFESAKF